MKKIALASRMGQITDPDYMGAKKTLTPNSDNWIKLSGLFRNYIGPDSATTVKPNVDCYDADPIHGVPE